MVRGYTTLGKATHSMKVRESNLKKAFEYLTQHDDVCGFTVTGDTALFYNASADDLFGRAEPKLYAVLFLKRYD